MRWTKHKPIKPGWYWVRRYEIEEPYVTPLWKAGCSISDYAGRKPSHVFYRGAKWAGPIPEPEDGK